MLELLQYIRNVYDKKPPRAKSRGGWFDKVRKFLDRFSFDSPNQWPTCIGTFERLSTVWDSSSKAMLDVLEYHYMIGNEAYAGFIPLGNGDVTFLDESSRKKDAGVKVGECIVSYRKADPCRCLLLPQTVYLSRTLLKKLNASQRKVLFSVKRLVD